MLIDQNKTPLLVFSRLLVFEICEGLPMGIDKIGDLRHPRKTLLWRTDSTKDQKHQNWDLSEIASRTGGSHEQVL